MADRDVPPEQETKQLDGDPLGIEGFAAIQQFHLTILRGPDQGATAQSFGERVVLGTHPACELVVKDDTVSRFHCDFTVEGQRVLLRDLDSRNGTSVDGVPVMQAYLRPGAVISAGRTQLRFDLAIDAVRVPVSDQSRFGVMVGTAPSMRRVFALLEKAAASDATVLLQGETGTGKEAAAESIHRESARAEGPFVVVDCSAIPAELLETELFGHEKGSFTGAHSARAGAFEAGAGGTVFLDEIGELSPDLQPKLLRALERREVKRVGSNKYLSVDVRLIAATHRDLRAEVNQQRFRADLYYRIAVIEVRLPALRERPEDLPILVTHLLDALGAAESDHPQLRGAAFHDELARHSWPGNVRELRNYIERCIALGDEATLTQPLGADSGPQVDLSRPLREARAQWLAPFEREYVHGLLERHSGNVTAAARAAGVDRVTFYRLLWKYGLR